MGLREDIARRAVGIWAATLGVMAPLDRPSSRETPVAAEPTARAEASFNSRPTPDSHANHAAASGGGGDGTGVAIGARPHRTRWLSIVAISVVVAILAWVCHEIKQFYEAEGYYLRAGLPHAFKARRSNDTATVAPASAPEPPPPPPPPVPRVTSLALKPSPGPGLVCKAGDDLTIVARFSRAVTVTGRPTIGFRVNGERTLREATFVRGDGGDELSFLFEVPRGDIDGTGIELTPSAAIALAGGSITDVSTGKAADLALSQPKDFAKVRIDGNPPRIIKLTMPQASVTYLVDTVLAFAVEFDEPVEASGEPELMFEAGAESRRARLTGGNGTATLRFSYRVADGDECEDGVVATRLLTARGSIADTAGNLYEGRFERVRSGEFAISTRPAPRPSPAKEKSAAGAAGGVVENSIGMKLVRIPAGEFEMGGRETAEDLKSKGFILPEDYQTSDERPVHRVRITKPFRMGMHEVTLGEFLSFYNDGYKGQLDCEKDGKGGWGYDAKSTAKAFDWKPEYRPWSWGHPDMDLSTAAGKERAFRQPVVNVSWNDCVAFCGWLSRKERKKYRLPTEAEWEYACRAGTTTRFWNGDDPEGLATIDNVADAALLDWAIRGSDGHLFPSPVGSFDDANLFGLHGMHGNVAEWCGDWYDKDSYTQFAGSVAVDPKGPSTGLFRVIRGGGWFSHPVNCRSAYRHNGTPTYRAGSVGFRVVCE